MAFTPLTPIGNLRGRTDDTGALLITGATAPSAVTVLHATSNITPIVGTTTSVIAAPAASTHLRIRRVHISNAGATAGTVGIRDGAAGNVYYATYLVQGSVISLNIDDSGPLDLTSATRLDIFSNPATGLSLNYTIDYEVAAD